MWFMANLTYSELYGKQDSSQKMWKQVEERLRAKLSY